MVTEKTKINTTDYRMLQVMEYCISNKLSDVTTMKAWCEKIGVSPTNIYNIRNGIQQFTVDHIMQTCKVFNISADYIFGFNDQMPRIKENLSPLERIKFAVKELEIQSLTE